MDLSSEAAERSLPLKKGGAVKVAVTHFQRKEGTIVTISTPLIQVSVYLVCPSQPPLRLECNDSLLEMHGDPGSRTSFSLAYPSPPTVMTRMQ
jgi:hypothetical protein